MSKIKTINILRGVGINGVMYQPGKTVRVSEEVATQLLRTSKAELAPEKKESISHAQKLEEKQEGPAATTEHQDKVAANKEGAGKPAPTGATDEEKFVAVKEAIASLDEDNKKLFNSEGEPLCNVLSDKVGFKVDGKLRDEATLSIMADAEEEEKVGE